MQRPSFSPPSAIASGGVPSVINSVDYSDVYMSVQYYNLTGQKVWKQVDVDSSGHFNITEPDNYSQFIGLYLVINDGSLPYSGTYTFSFNILPNAGGVNTWSNLTLEALQQLPNTSPSYAYQTISFQQDGWGQVYATSNINTSNYSSLRCVLYTDESWGWPFNGDVNVNFTKYYGSDLEGPVIDSNMTSGDVQQNINSTVTNISNAVSSVDDSIRELIQTISNQLTALWNQFAGEFTNMYSAWNTHVQTITGAIQQQADTVSDGLTNVAGEVSQGTEEIKENEDKNTNIITNALSALGNFIIEGLKSLFIPSDDFFQNWYTDIYDFFNDRLGLFMLPLDIVIQLLNIYLNTDSSFAGIPFPEFEWIDGTVIIPAQTVGFAFLDTDWGQDLQQKIYFVGDVFMIFSLLVLLKQKLDEVFTR